MKNLNQPSPRKLMRVALHMARSEKLSSALPSSVSIKRAFVPDTGVIALALAVLIVGILVVLP